MILTLMLICAITMSLALGVLAAYAVCFGMFRIFRWRSVAAAQARVAAAAQVAVEG